MSEWTDLIDGIVTDFSKAEACGLESLMPMYLMARTDLPLEDARKLVRIAHIEGGADWLTWLRGLEDRITAPSR